MRKTFSFEMLTMFLEGKILLWMSFLCTWKDTGGQISSTTPGTTTTVPLNLDLNSCAGRCIEAYFPGRPCYCNEACNTYENCCDDYYLLCAPDFVWSDDWLEYNNHLYKFFTEREITENEARQECKKHAGLLVSINTEEEFDFISLKVLRKYTLSAYIGGNDVDGIWVWQDGRAMPMLADDWSGWLEGQPNNADGSRNCAIMTNYGFWETIMFKLSNYGWRSHVCDVNEIVQGYICERTLECAAQPCENNGTCVYVGGDREYACECTDGYVGDHCQYQLIDGALWTECGETNLVAGSVAMTLTSPLYPQQYPPNVQCEWRIATSSGKTVQISLMKMDIEVVKECAFDYLKVYDGENKLNSSLLFGLICGSSALGTSYTTSGNEAIIEFHTDHTVHETGFLITYKEEECGQAQGDSGCGTSRLFTAHCGSISLEMPSADRAHPCEIIISVQENQVINLTFHSFQIYDSGKSCEKGALHIYDGMDDTIENLIGSYCGFHFPWYTVSNTNQIIMKMTITEWTKQDIVTADYTTIDTTKWTHSTSYPKYNIELEANDTYSISTSNYEPNVLHNNIKIHRFSVKYQPGGQILIQNISGRLDAMDRMKIYDGFSEQSKLLTDLHNTSQDLARQEGMLSTGFQIYIVTEQAMDSKSRLTFYLKTQELSYNLSRCYRPYYADYIEDSTRQLENHIIEPLLPLVVMVSEELEYEPGLYCQWTLHSQPGHQLSLTFLDVMIPPLSEHCDYDGVVIYDGQDKHGPYCGSNAVDNFLSVGSDVRVVFYSDTAGSTRKNGLIRILAEDNDGCPVYKMENDKFISMESDCGVVLSPGFPGLVNPGHWYWTISLQSKDKLFAVYVHYVRGPGVRDDDCEQYFRVKEIPYDASAVTQRDDNKLKICGDTALYIPKERIMLPVKQKLGLVLNTLKLSIPVKWQFKVSYIVEDMVVPDHMTSDVYVCPEEYHLFRDSCYLNIPWVIRHYNLEEYSFQETWQKSLQYCETQQNGTLVTISDEAEAYFLKYKMSTSWFWDNVGTFQSNARLIFIGLHNKYSVYEWTDGIRLSYAEWFVPREATDQDAILFDAFAMDFLDMRHPQPNADVGSLCVAMLPTSPFSSLNWVKIPCDYPIYRAGLICERKASVKPGMLKPSTKIPKANMQYEACPKDWIMIENQCLRLLTNYAAMRDTNDANLVWTYTDALLQCETLGGSVAAVNATLLSKIGKYFSFWRHDPDTGDIWIQNDASENSRIIKVYKERTQDETTLYRLQSYIMTTSISSIPTNVLCQTNQIMKSEWCRDQEFTCVADGSCVSVDGVCDGIADCPDASDEMNCDCGDAMYQCADGACIPISLYCDFRQDCHDGSDELNCVLRDCFTDEFRCSSGQCVAKDKLCDFVLDCLDGSDEDRSHCGNQCNGMQCYSGTCIHPRLRKDLISDCPGLAAEDEVDVDDLLSFEVRLNDYLTNTTEYIGCDDGSSVPCRKGAPKCYNRDRTCIYDTVRINEAQDVVVQESCRDGTHMRNMCGEHSCPGLFHCPGSFCLPHRKLCDGIKDCPDGADEAMSMCQEYTCPGLYRCKGESFCISHDEVCDGKVHCPLYRDDEKYCYNYNTVQKEMPRLCAQKCTCTGFVIDCTNANLSEQLTLPEDTSQIKALLLSFNNITLHSNSFLPLHSLGRLILSHNSLIEIPVGAFKNLNNLFDLDLSFNLISHLESSVLEGLVSLRKLNIDSNNLLGVSRATLAPLVSINHLIITNNVLQDIEEDIFEDVLTLRVLNTDAYKFCCVAPQTKTCTPEADEFSSCEDLLANYPLQICIWVLGVMAFVGNLFVIIWRIRQKSQTISAFYIINLGCSDFLMGMYMLIIASVDTYYRGDYIVYADSWRSSALCQISGILAMLSSEVSVFMLTAITIDRVLNILFPLKMGNIRLKHARIVGAIGWSVCFFLSVLPALKVPYFGDAFFGRTGVCLPFQVSSEKVAGWEYSVFIFLALNLLSFIIIFAGYIAIFMRVKASIETMKEKSTSTMNEYALAKKLAVVVATDFLCWVPIILIGIAALAGAKVSPQVSAWIAVFILPLNSAMNPLLYTISAMDCGKKKRNPALNSANTASTSATRTAMKMVPPGNGSNSQSGLISGDVAAAKTPVINGRNDPQETTVNGFDATDETKNM